MMEGGESGDKNGPNDASRVVCQWFFLSFFVYFNANKCFIVHIGCKL